LRALALSTEACRFLLYFFPKFYELFLGMVPILLHYFHHPLIAPIADGDFAALKGDKIEVRNRLGAGQGGDGLGVPVPDADGFRAGEWPDDEDSQEKQQREAAEDGSDAAKHELILTSALLKAAR